MVAGFDPNLDPLVLLVTAVANPVVIVVAFYLGWRADQWQKLVIAGFGAAIAGAFAIWCATFAGLLAPRPFGSDAGVFVFSFVYGIAVAAAGYVLVRRNR